jgi:hypothetical protein
MHKPKKIMVINGKWSQIGAYPSHGQPNSQDTPLL